ncbi:MAG: hypothetical protein D6705_13020 [Deltaproteobacteria bacterium]|nr:MAG: hypothetical protein D6705_13020 [Deltaproteobacteria bacterium]
MQIVPLPATEPMFADIRGDLPERRATGPPVFVIANRRDDGVVTLPAAVEVVRRTAPGRRGHDAAHVGRHVDDYV